MRIKCPDCFAQFDVPNGAIKKGGRQLRCGQCKHQWHQLPIIESTLNDIPGNNDETIGADSLQTLEDISGNNDEIIEAAQLKTVAEFPVPPVLRKEDLKKTTVQEKHPFSFSLIILLVITVITLIGVLFARNIIVDYTPETSILFDTLGLHVPVTGESLIIKNVGVWREKKGSIKILAVKGEIFNPSKIIQTVPIISGSEIDVTGRVLASDSFIPEAATLLPNETIKFEYQTPFPNEKTVSVIITFSDDKRTDNFGY
jgi:predicted Zn finger-like uncharacterized protein